MAVTVKFLGEYREKTGTDDLFLSPKKFSTVQSVLEALPGMFPELDLSNATTALNSRTVDGKEPLRDNDELAIFPPVTGG